MWHPPRLATLADLSPRQAVTESPAQCAPHNRKENEMIDFITGFFGVFVILLMACGAITLVSLMLVAIRELWR